jgi:hypothetical protein
MMACDDEGGRRKTMQQPTNDRTISKAGIGDGSDGDSNGSGGGGGGQ